MNPQPAIVVSTLDGARLERLLESLPAQTTPGKAALEQELARAQWVPPEELPANRVSMHSIVRFRVLDSGEHFTRKLVYPGEQSSDPSEPSVSILAPVGSALLGLAEGDRINWPKPGGGSFEVEIEAVLSQPERGGQRGG